MSRASRALPALLAVAVVVGACTTEPEPSASPTTRPESASPTRTVAVTDSPFSASSWPAAGSACNAPGYTGRIGRIEAVSARTIRFRLCAPDGAFLARIASPALGILDSATIERLGADPGAARSIAGTGPYRIDHWDEGGDAILVAAAAGSAAGRGAPSASLTPTVILRWNADPAQRAAELQSASVDGIDAPGPAQIGALETLPEVVMIPRAGLSTAYLAFGSDPAFDDVRVRRAIAGAVDRDALVDRAFPAGSTVATHLAPCQLAGACAGDDWYPFNGPAAAADLATAGFDLGATYALHVPDRPVPGLPDPRGLALALQAALLDSIGLSTTIDVMDVATWAARIADGGADGLYLGGTGDGAVDAADVIAATLGPDDTATPARRAPDVAAALASIAATADPGARQAGLKRANDAIRSMVPLIPLAHAGSVTAFRADVTGVVTSPLGVDPLGSFTPGDRPQLVFMQGTDPGGAYCADRSSPDAYRACSLITEPLYRFAPGTMEVQPGLATRCTANGDASVWTCTLRQGVRFQDDTQLDAGDVLATFAAQWNGRSAVRVARPAGSFAAWDALFGGTVDGG